MALLFGGSLLLAVFTPSIWPRLLVPIPAFCIGWLFTSWIATVFPRIRFIDSREIDGLGYIHQPLGPMLLVCLIGFAAVIIRIFR